MSDSHEVHGNTPGDTGAQEGDSALSKVIPIGAVQKRRGPSKASSSQITKVEAAVIDATPQGKKAIEIEKGKKKLARLVKDGAMELPHPEQPARVADKLLSTEWTAQGRRTLVHWNRDFYEWTGPCWVRIDEDALESKLHSFTEYAYSIKVIDDEEIAVDWNPNNRKIGELVSALRRKVNNGHMVDGAWLDGRVTGERYASCANGLLRLSDQTLVPHTPEYFNLFALSFNYDEKAKAPEWERFLDSVWSEDPEARLALQQWFAYVLSGRMDLHKLVMIVGATRSGKGTIADVLKGLLGAENVSGPTLEDFGMNFGLTDMIGKPLAIIDDARAEGRIAGTTVGRMLTISGAGTLNIDRKNKTAWTGILPSRLMILTNELPNMADASGALMARMRILRMTESFVGREDRTLGARLNAEMAGILNWTLEGLALLEKYGDIIQPSASEDMVRVQRRSGGPFGAFLEDCCNVGEKKFEVPKEALRAAWNKWCDENGQANDFENDASFGRKMLSAVPAAKASRKRVDGARVCVYTHIELDLDKQDRADREADIVEAEEMQCTEPIQGDLGIPGLTVLGKVSDDVVLQQGDRAMLPLVRVLMSKMPKQQGAVSYPGSAEGLAEAGRRMDVTVPMGEGLTAFDRMFRVELKRLAD